MGVNSANVIRVSPRSILCIVYGLALSQPGLFHLSPAASGMRSENVHSTPKSTIIFPS